MIGIFKKQKYFEEFENNWWIVVTKKGLRYKYEKVGFQVLTRVSVRHALNKIIIKE